MSHLSEFRVPSFCPVCGWIMKGSKSISTYYDYGCCIDCFIDMLDTRPAKQEAWKSGWRPSAEEIQAMVDRRS